MSDNELEPGDIRPVPGGDDPIKDIDSIPRFRSDGGLGHESAAVPCSSLATANRRKRFAGRTAPSKSH
jgi:hypothetical protein